MQYTNMQYLSRRVETEVAKWKRIREVSCHSRSASLGEMHTVRCPRGHGLLARGPGRDLMWDIEQHVPLA